MLRGEALSVADLTGRRWDVIVVGAGHNGLTAAAYLARGGLSVLVLERRDRVGGACTIEQPFEDPAWRVSPCAYVVGLLDPLVIDELGLADHGYRVHPIEPHLWCPFADGTALTLWDDRDRTAAEIANVAPSDVDGYLAYQSRFGRIRDRLRHGRRDAWVGEAPDRAELEDLLGRDTDALDVVLSASIADVVEAHVRDERLRTALHGQGIIGTNAGPRDAGTAGIHLLHSMGTLEGRSGAWGFVEGGMGQVSFALAAAARSAGAVVTMDAAVGAIVPGEGVRLEGGDTIAAPIVIANTDPKRTLGLIDGDVPGPFRARVEQWRSDSPVVKVNCGLSALPSFTADVDGIAARAMVTLAGSIDDTQAAFEAGRRGEPAPRWCELYFHTVYDPTVAPPGKHTMSVFAQYVPYRLATGTWDDRRAEVGQQVIDLVDEVAPATSARIEHVDVLAPPDVESRIGLTGGHIFQGECLPDQMWDRRFSPRTPIDGLYLCGAATHPGGSVIGLNGRNAAMAVLQDRPSSRRRAR